MEILKVSNIKKVYGNGETVVNAIKGISLSIEEGEFVAIVGTSGSGKSTLLHIIGGLDTSSSGDVVLGNKSITNMNDDELTVFRRREIGFIFQNYNLVTSLNTYENITLPVELDHGKIDTEYIDQLVEKLGLSKRIQNKATNLSGGEQQRVAIARALVMKPKIILADEPTGNLDSHNSIEVLDLLKKMNKELNQTILMITHNEKIAQMADRIIRIEDGLIV